jgi:hypothetical protein
MGNIITVHVPMAFRWRGGRKLIVTPDATATPAAPSRFNVDHVLVKALARGFRWRKLLDEGSYTTINDISAHEKIDRSYVAEVLRLTLLVPDIMEMILDGRQPREWQLLQFRRSFPLEWEVQRALIRRHRSSGQSLRPNAIFE